MTRRFSTTRSCFMTEAGAASTLNLNPVCIPNSVLKENVISIYRLELVLEQAIKVPAGDEDPPDEQIRAWMDQISAQMVQKEPVDLILPPPPPDPRVDAPHICPHCFGAMSVTDPKASIVDCPKCSRQVVVSGEMEYVCPHCTQHFWAHPPAQHVEVTCPHCRQPVSLVPM